jgi:hypothetical protein
MPSSTAPPTVWPSPSRPSATRPPEELRSWSES